MLACIVPDTTISCICPAPVVCSRTTCELLVPDVSDKKITWLAVRYCSMGRKDFFDDRVAHKVCLYRVLK